MKLPTWSKEDFVTGLDYLVGHEEEAQTSSILDTGFGVTVILPHGLPSHGLTFHGVFIIAPILVFTSVLVGFIGIGFIENWDLNVITISLAVFCIVLLWGLHKVFLLLLSDRELFPRRHFVTLGLRGIAMHFTHFQFPTENPRASIPWEDVKQLRRGIPCLFLPALLKGIPAVQTLEVDGNKGKVFIPFRLDEGESFNHSDEIIKVIKNKLED